MRPSASPSGFASERQADERGNHERNEQIDQQRERITPRPAEVFGEQDAQHDHSRSSRPVSWRNTSFRLGRLRHNILDADGQGEQILEALGWVARADRRHDQLALGFLDDAKALVETGPRIRRGILEIGFQDEQAIAAQPIL